MTKEEKRKLQKIQIDILEEISRICKKNKLTFFLVGGSCLGAVRHDGFIPWDDDVDIGMMRKDYEKFLNICKKELNKKYFLQTENTDYYYPQSFAKIRVNHTLFQEKLNLNKNIHQGIFVDIFPFDYNSNNKIIRYWMQIKTVLIRITILLKLNYSVTGKNRLQKTIIKFIKLTCNLFSLDWLRKILNKNVNRYNKKKTGYISNYVGNLLFKDIYDSKLFDSYKLHIFEDKQYLIPKNYDKYLTTLYGDYMTPPPKKEREIGHDVIKIDFHTKKKKGI